ncbi:acyl-[acyl-carrier-protein] thioesterase [Atopococcus tabaci]|uniref:acyl-[acyl-carrier-protein] thioesterase n=1 Tax=Atopococcus tabaci TaxID=269774 RepID=UPI0024095B05|nr:acyl-ACP thioesterase domain-containing protein [Atopococcus tabaci]
MSGKKYSRPHQVRSYECDQTQKMTLPMLLNILMEVSGEQSRLLERGEEDMMKRGLGWIILQYTMDIQRMPRMGETVEVETQAVQYNKIFTYRHFTVYDKQGKTLVKVQTTFAAIDLEKRKMARITEDLIAPYEAPFEKRLVRVAKPEPVDDDHAHTTPYRVRFFDIDSNRHVNNSRYVDWTLDALGQDFLTTHEMTHANIKFDKEVLYGQMIDSVCSVREEHGTVVTSHRIQREGTTHCAAHFYWKKMEE